MKVLMKNYLGLCLLLSFIFLSACKYHDIIKKYPDFEKEKLLIDSIMVLTDLEIKFNSNKPLSDYQLKIIGKDISNYMSRILLRKGYPECLVLEPSIYGIYKSGMRIGNSEKVNLVKSPPWSTYKVNVREYDRYRSYKDKRRFIYLFPYNEDTTLTRHFPNYSVPIDSSVKILDFERVNVLALIQLIGVVDDVAMVRELSPGNAAIIRELSPVVKIKFWLIDRRTRKLLWYDQTSISSLDFTDIRALKLSCIQLFRNFPSRDVN